MCRIKRTRLGLLLLMAFLPAVVPAEDPPAEAVSTPAQQRRNIQNPAISAVFQLTGDAALSDSEESGGFDLSEVELALESVVDPYLRMGLYVSLPAEGSIEVEEAYVTTLALPAQLQLKGGRYFVAFGKWNLLHSHAFPTVDKPDALTLLLGEESLAFDGLSLSYLIPNPSDLYIELIGQVGSARESAAFNSAERNLSWLGHLGFFFDTTPSSTLEFGLTASGGSVGPSEALLGDIEDGGLGDVLEPGTALDSSVSGLDITYIWKPLQQNVYRSFTWQTEFLYSRRDVEELTPALTLLQETLTSMGGYSYLEYQYARRWRVGGRYDRTVSRETGGPEQWAGSVVLRIQPSEFQEIRVQYKHSRWNQAAVDQFGIMDTDNRIFVEWVPVIGAHGAHRY
jgi:hypothetical protein